MSRGPGHVMRAVEQYIAALPFNRLTVNDTDYRQLAAHVYGLNRRDTDDQHGNHYEIWTPGPPTRSQLAAVSRAVRALERQGKAVRELRGYIVEPDAAYYTGIDIKPARHNVVRETRVTRPMTPDELRDRRAYLDEIYAKALGQLSR